MKKKYAINIENDQVVSMEVDGVKYDSIDQIPDPEDREKMTLLMSDAEADAADEDNEAEALEAEEIDNLTMDMNMPDVNSDKMSKVVFSIFFGIAVLLLIISAVSAFFTFRSLGKEQTAEGRVVDMVRRTDSNGNEFYFPVVQFTIPGHDSRTVQTSEGSWPPSYSKGDRVTISYNPDQPNQARIKSFESAVLTWLVTMITGGLGAIFLVVSFLIYRFTQPEKTETRPGEIPTISF